MINKLLFVFTIGILLTGCTQKNVSMVPLPTEEDIIRNFFALIDEKRASEAVNMMVDKQDWETQFKNFDSVKIVDVKKSTEDNLYQVTLDAKVNEITADYPIPYYGYGSGADVRFIKLVKNDKGIWKIKEIGTGP